MIAVNLWFQFNDTQLHFTGVITRTYTDVSYDFFIPDVRSRINTALHQGSSIKKTRTTFVFEITVLKQIALEFFETGLLIKFQVDLIKSKFEWKFKGTFVAQFFYRTIWTTVFSYIKLLIVFSKKWIKMWHFMMYGAIWRISPTFIFTEFLKFKKMSECKFEGTFMFSIDWNWNFE